MSDALNVVLILADDQGSRDAACYGAPDVSTPNLDRLADEGVRFTDFYANAPICMPTRASLLTGRDYPRCLVPGRGLRPGEVTVAAMCRRAGYRTALFGKWHLGETATMGPNAQGFDEFLGHTTGNLDLYSHFFYVEGVNRHVLQRDGKPHHVPGRYLPDLLVEAARAFIDADARRPFFLYVPFSLPHYPLQPRLEIHRQYQERLPDDPRRALHAACVTTLDQCVGRLLEHLDARGLAGRTLVIYLSDNGHSVEERAFHGGGYAGPFRGAKQTLWEAGIRVPCLARSPGRIPAGQVREQPAIGMDWVPTMAQLCGFDLPDDLPVDGRSLVPVLTSAQAPPPHERLHWVHYDGSFAVREGHWKLHSTPGHLWLTDLTADPGERTNLAAAQGPLVKDLVHRHNAWLREVTAATPGLTHRRRARATAPSEGGP